MEEQQRVTQLFEDYLHYRRHTAHFKRMQATIPYLRDPKLKPERREALEAMMAFCQEHNLDARWYLYSLFHARRWNAAPRWDQLVPGTKKTEKRALKRYALLKDAPLYSQRVTQELHQEREAAGLNYDPNRDLSTTTENLKKKYLAVQDTERCMAEMQTGTLGYHPRSLVCARCPAKAECETRLQASVPFDIVALRRGEISSDQAKRMAGRFSAGR